MIMLAPISKPVPIRINKDGVARVGGTRVTLDTVVEAFKEGASPEEIVQQYPSLQLVDVYAVITYYLQATEEVEAYLRERQQRAEAVRRENEASFNPEGVLDRLLARRKLA
jgi:uncharacterized protein (DUF433 family)